MRKAKDLLAYEADASKGYRVPERYEKFFDQFLKRNPDIRIRRLDNTKSYLQGWVETLFNESPRLSTMRRIRPLTRQVIHYLKLLSRISDMHLNLEQLQMPDDPWMLIYLAASLLQVPPSEKHDPAAIAEKLNGRAGIVEHGLFIGLAHDVIVAGREGIRHLKRRP